MTRENRHTEFGHDEWLFLRKQVITRDDGRPYLERFILWKTPWFGLYLHKFLGDDDVCAHDHPWPFLSLIVLGRYWEYARNPECPSEEIVDRGTPMLMGNVPWLFPPRLRRPGSVAAYPATHAHRVVLEGGRPCYTLVVTGPKVRPWGFWTRFGWVPWRKYSHARHCA